MVFYPAIVLYLLGGSNVLDAAFAGAIGFMTLTIAHGLFRLSRGMG